MTPHDVDNRVYEIAVGRADVTPAPGIRLSGYAVREGVSHAVHEPLTLTVLAVRAQGHTVALVAVDVLLMSPAFARTMRLACAKELGTSADHVMVNASHTHSSPAADRYQDFDVPEQLALQEKFRKTLLDGVTQASRAAADTFTPARLSIGWGSCRANINRRQPSPGHGMLLGENPDGACDHDVGVLRADDLQGKPLAVVFLWACHTVTIGPKTHVISPDFVGPARRLIESTLDCPSLFLQGCAGNVNPITGIGQDAQDDACFLEDTDRIGHALGAEVVKVAQSLRTHRKRKHPVLVQSIAVYWMYQYESIEPGGPGPLGAVEGELELPLTPFGPIDAIRTERDQWMSQLANARAKGEREWVIHPLIRFGTWAQRRLDAATTGPNPHTVRLPLQVIALGDLRIVCIPFEPMAETGLALRDALGRDRTFVLGYANGVVSYLPTPTISAEGGMEAKLGYKAYLLPSQVPGDWEATIRQRLIQMAQTLTKE